MKCASAFSAYQRVETTSHGRSESRKGTIMSYTTCDAHSPPSLATAHTAPFQQCLFLLAKSSHASLQARRVRYTMLTCAVYCLSFRPRAVCGGGRGLSLRCGGPIVGLGRRPSQSGCSTSHGVPFAPPGVSLPSILPPSCPFPTVGVSFRVRSV